MLHKIIAVVAVLATVMATATSQAQEVPDEATLQRGHSGLRVSAWQHHLKEWLALTSSERHPIGVDGVFGPETEAATRAFERIERDQGSDGTVDDADRATLHRAIERRATSGDGPAPMVRGSRGPAVVWWQEQLADWLWSTGSERPPPAADGVFGAATEASTREFQSAHDTLDTDLVVHAADRAAMAEALADALPYADGFEALASVTTVSDFGLGGGGVARWRREVPGIEELRIPSSIDGHAQPALWLAPEGDGDQPLLVVVHSWSSGYEQEIDIPLGLWAQEQGWGMIHPHFRGRFRAPDATGSDLAVRDVIDAVEFSLDQDGVDADRVFVIGVSGGGMMSLLMAGRHPDLFAGAVSWVPVHDLVSWYTHVADEEIRYAREIVASCGGPPDSDDEAAKDCLARSPRSYLDDARRAGLPVYVAHGLDDTLVPPDHALRAFNQLAAPADRLGNQVLRRASRNQLPDGMRGSIEAETYFGPDDPAVEMSRHSGAATVVVFDGEHDMAYRPGLAWIRDRAGT